MPTFNIMQYKLTIEYIIYYYKQFIKNTVVNLKNILSQQFNLRTADQIKHSFFLYQ